MMKERFMAIFIGLIMLVSVVGFALMRPIQTGDNEPVGFPSVINRSVTNEERLGILRSGLVLIEYLYPKNCTECPEKSKMYENFVSSPEFNGYAVLSMEAIENETADWLLNLNGDRLDLEKINTMEDLQKFFCDHALRKPSICILQEV